MQVLPSALLLCALCRFLARAAQPPLASEEPDAAAGERASKFLDHVVTKEQAAQAASKFDVSKLGVSDEVGCGKCSLQERMYCVSDAVLSDHCCCDKHLEPMPFVPHRCYVNLPPAAPCAPIAGNCAQYSRIYDCCCKHILQQRFPARPVHSGWLASLFSLMGLQWSEREPYGDPVPNRPHAGQSSAQSYATSQFQPHSNFSSFSLSDEIPQFAPLNETGHNKLVSGAHVPRGGLVALLATLAMLLFRW